MRIIDADDLIRRQDAIDALGEVHPLDYNALAILKELKEIPAVDVVKRKSGKWIIDPKTQDGYCSVCNCDMPICFDDWKYKSMATEYCPNCGAKMEGREDETD